MTRIAVALGCALTLSGCRSSAAGQNASGASASATTSSDGAAGAPGSTDTGPASLRNLVAKCVRLELGGVRTERNVTLAAAKLGIASPIGNCGCKSAMVSYRSVQRVHGREIEAARGGVNTLKIDRPTAEIYLVLATDRLPRNARLTIVVGCQDPD
jgi:hypothetical protein